MNYKLEILKANYQEHIKFEKELSFILPIDHPKRILLLEASNELIKEINLISIK